MSDVSLVPVDYQPDFENVSLVPVDYNPFPEDELKRAPTQVAQIPIQSPQIQPQAQQAQFQQPQTQTQPAQPEPQTQPQQPATGVGRLYVGPANNTQASAVSESWNPDTGNSDIQRTPTYSDPQADAAAMSPETYVNPFVRGLLGNLATALANLPQRAFEAAAEDVQHLGDHSYSPQSIGPAVDTALMMGGMGALRAERGAAGALGGKLPTPASPEILSQELAGQTRTQIRDLATKKGLVPKGDPSHPDYPRRWSDPVTNGPRLRLDRGHIDSKTGQPFNIPNAAVDHVHGYDVNGNSIRIDGDNHIPTTGE